jgi:hypothetical protein
MLAAVTFRVGFLFICEKEGRCYSVKTVIVVVLCVPEEMMRHHQMYTKRSLSELPVCW